MSLIFNVNNFSHIYSCTWTEYQNILNSAPTTGSPQEIMQEYDEYGLYLVDVGLTFLCAYYGRRKLTDILGVTGLPISEDYPYDKLYFLLEEKQEGQFFIKDICYKYMDSQSNAPKVAILQPNYVRSLEIDTEGHLITMETGNNDKSAFLIIENGQLNEDVLRSILEGISDIDISKDLFAWSQWE